MASTLNQPIRGRNLRNKRRIAVADGEKLLHGTFVFIRTDGLAYASFVDSTDIVGGIARDEFDNTDGHDGDIYAEAYQSGTFWFPMAGAAQTHVGTTLYVSDNYTVTDSSVSTLLLGTCVDVDALAAFVEVEFDLAGVAKTVAPGPMDTGTLNYNAYRMASVGTGFFNSYGATLYNERLILTNQQLEDMRYVFTPRVQQIHGNLRNTDLSRWNEFKALYASKGIDRPKRIQVLRFDEFQFMPLGSDEFTDANIYASGPHWEQPSIVTPHANSIALPPASILDVPWSSVYAGGLTWAAAETILLANGWTFTNASANPLGNAMPYEFQEPVAKQLRFANAKAQINNADWVESLTDYVQAAVEDTNLGDMDGALVLPAKFWQYQSHLFSGAGIKPDGSTDGIAARRFEYWIRRRAGGADPDPSVAWDANADSPAWLGGSDARIFDVTAETDAYEAVEGFIAFCQALKTKLVGKQVVASVCFETTSTGIWQERSGLDFAQAYRVAYQGLFGGSLQQAQNALRGKIEAIAAIVDVLIWPQLDQSEHVDEFGVTIEPAGWFASMTTANNIQYASVF